MGLKASEMGLRKLTRSQQKTRVGGWSKEEDDRLIAIYSETPTDEVAQILGKSLSSVKNRAQRLNLEKKIWSHRAEPWENARRRYPVSERVFIDLTPEAAYVIGFILADGSIQAGPRWVLKISNTDELLLRKIRSVLGVTVPFCSERQKSTAHKPGFSLLICSKHLVCSLVDRGITPNKSLTAHVPQIPDSLFWHFLRGYFDGDGSVSAREGLRTRFVSGSVELLSEIAQRISQLSEIGLRPVPCDKGRNHAFRLSYGAEDSRRLAALMYRDCGDLYMTRKRDVFESQLSRAA